MMKIKPYITEYELRGIRNRYGLTQKEVSKLLQIGEKTWTLWETGKQKPSKSMTVLLLALYENQLTIKWLKSLQ